jgi:EAL domain-containing protein (putative c-di-GMP-specific phosphodiesterase class I)/GGDEF domain-containing protein
MPDTPSFAERPGGVAAPESGARARDEAGRRFVAFSFCRADILLEVDDEQRISFAAGTMRAILGKKSQELVGRPLADIIHEPDRRLVADLLGAGQAEGRVNDVAVRLVSVHQVPSEALLSGYRVPDFGNHFFIALKLKPRPQPTPRRRAQDRDDESGVLNREAFAATAAERMRSAQDAGLNPQLTLVKIGNLDRLKDEIGDVQQQQVLGKIGDILKSRSVAGDTAGRVDDRSFAFVHGGNVNVEAVTRDIAAAAGEAGGRIELTTESATMAADAAALSDDQMAKAIVYTMQQFSDKGAQSAGGSLSEMLERRMAETVKQVARFRRICATRDFDLAYMPICDLKTRKVHHVEALARFRVAGDASGSPYKMIAMAEELQLIADFDLAVATKVVDVLKRGGAQGRVPPIAINVSGNSIADAAFVERLHEILGRAVNLRDLIGIEITESSKIENLESVNATIQGFRNKGFKVALDDFGAGAAGFDYLNALDVDAIKFDGPVVKRAYATAKGKAFLASMAELCKQSGIESVAEMVENEALAKFLADVGVHLGQGYYFAKPSMDIGSFLPGTVVLGKP